MAPLIPAWSVIIHSTTNIANNQDQNYINGKWNYILKNAWLKQLIKVHF